MALPKSVMKVNKDGVQFISNVDQVEYSIHELSRAALRDVGKFIVKNAKQRIPKKTGRGRKNIQYFVLSKQKYPSLQVGIKPAGFYTGFMELGTNKQPKIGALTNTTYENIDMITKIQAQYLSAITSGTVEKYIDETEEEGDEVE